MERLVHIYGAQKSWKEAEALQVQVAKIRENVSGPEDPSTLASLSYLAVLYYKQDRCQEAIPLGLETMEISKRVLGQEDSRTLISISNLAAMFGAIRYLHEARAFEQQVLDIRRERLGEQYPQTIKSLAFMASLDDHERTKTGVRDLTLTSIVSQELSWTHLCVTRQAFVSILIHFRVFVPFLDLVHAFGRKTHVNKRICDSVYENISEAQGEKGNKILGTWQ